MVRGLGSSEDGGGLGAYPGGEVVGGFDADLGAKTHDEIPAFIDAGGDEADASPVRWQVGVWTGDVLIRAPTAFLPERPRPGRDGNADTGALVRTGGAEGVAHGGGDVVAQATVGTTRWLGGGAPDAAHAAQAVLLDLAGFDPVVRSP